MSVNSRCPACRRLLIGSCEACKQSKKLSQQRRCERLQATGLCITCSKPTITRKCDDCKTRHKEKRKKTKRKTPINKEVWLARRRHYMQKNFKNWLRVCLCSSRTKRKNRDIRCDLTIDELVELLNRQKERCAITNLPMVHKCGDLRAVSIDRIDSSGHYTIKNVQLVCKAINFAKSNRSNHEIAEFVAAIRTMIPEPIDK